MRLEALATPTIFNASDLRQNRRALDAAKEAGVARVRDADGTALLVAREEAVGDALRERDALSIVAEAALRLHGIEGLTVGELTDTVLGEWRWVRTLDDEDRQAFFSDMWSALAEARSDASSSPVQEALADWRETARALADPERRRKLIAPIEAGDFVEIRPE
jgi:hypothetical protein